MQTNAENELQWMVSVGIKYFQTTIIKSSVELERQQPTEGVGEQHCYKLYFEAETWHGRKLTCFENTI